MAIFGTGFSVTKPY